jgi:hypothetical protein
MLIERLSLSDEWHLSYPVARLLQMSPMPEVRVSFFLCCTQLAFELCDMSLVSAAQHLESTKLLILKGFSSNGL